VSRRSWDSLSVAYRNRLVRGGISREEYEAGTSLSAARGHRSTPERPERALRNPSMHVDYLDRVPRNLPKGKRAMRFNTPDGVVILKGLSRRDRSTVAQCENARRQLLNPIYRFGKSFDQLRVTSVSGIEVGTTERKMFHAETDPRRIYAQAHQTTRRYTDIYAEAV
jgi:hypothetical protein